MQWLFDFIQKLQLRPAGERKKISALIAGVITGVIFMFWLSAKITSPVSLRESESASTPLNSLKEMIKNTFQDAKDFSGIFNEAKDTSKDERQTGAQNR